jgi:hypothetical protein
MVGANTVASIGSAFQKRNRTDCFFQLDSVILSELNICISGGNDGWLDKRSSH